MMMTHWLARVREALGLESYKIAETQEETRQLVEEACRTVEEVKEKRIIFQSRPSVAEALIAARDRE